MTTYTTAKTNKTKGRVQSSDAPSSFILKSYQLLDDQKFPHIVDWNEQGTALVIKEPLEFAQIVLPTYFKHSNLTSFVRQLNMYHFRKRRTQIYEHVYCHELFQRGKADQLKDIKRKVQDMSLSNVQKAIENLKKSIDNEQLIDEKTEEIESQLLKKVNRDAIQKIDALETKLKELADRNEMLRGELNQKSKKEELLISFVSHFLKKKGISVDYLYHELNNQLKPSSKSLVKREDAVRSDSCSYTPAKDQLYQNLSIEDLLGSSENCSNSTEVPSWSPQYRSQYDLAMPNIQEAEDESRIQYGKRGFFAQEDEFEGMNKMIKTEDSYNRGFVAPYPTNTGVGNQEESYDLNIRSSNSFGDLLSTMDHFSGDGFDLMTF